LRERVEEAHLLFLVIAYHETFNIQKVKSALLHSLYPLFNKNQAA